MAITVAMRTQVSQLYVSLFGRAPDGEGLGFWVGALNNGMSFAQVAESMYNTSPARAYYPSFATNEEIISTFYQNVLGRPADAEGLAFWTAELNNAATKGEVFAKLINNVVNYTGTNADGLVSQALLLNKVEVARYYGETNGDVAGATAALTGVTSDAATVAAAKAAIDAGPAPAPQTFTLTTGTDALTAGNAADLVIAQLGELTTLQSSDQIYGNDGADTLRVVTDGVAAQSVSGFQLSSVEKIEVQSGAVGGTTLGLARADAALATVSSNGSTSDVTVSDLAQLVSAEISSTTGTSLTLAYAAAAVAGATTQSLAVNAANAAFNAAGVETVNVVATGANTLTFGTAPATVNVSGAGTLALGALTATTTALNATQNTGGVTAAMGASATATVTGGDGADSIDVSAVTGIATVSTGAGNDTITATSNLTATDVIDGGAGTDTLVVANASQSLTKVTNVEVLKASGALTVTLGAAAQAAGINTVKADGANALSVTTTATDYTNALAVTLGTGADSVTNTANVALTVNAAESAVTNADALTGGTGVDTLVVTADAGSLNLSTVSGFEVVRVLPNATTAAEDVSVVLGNNTVATGKTLTIDASALVDTGATLTVDASSNQPDEGVSVIGGAGADTITGGVGNDVISTGAGADSIVASTGNDHVDAGAGDDAIVFAGNLTAADTVDGGDGIDTLVVTSVTSAALTNVSNVEKLSFSTDATLAGNLSFTNFDLSAVAGGQTLTLAAGYTNATTVTLGALDVVVNTANAPLTVNATVTALMGATNNDDNTEATVTGGTGVDTLNVSGGGILDLTRFGTSITAVDRINLKDVGDAATGATAAGSDYTVKLSSGTSVTVDASELDAGTNDANGDANADWENAFIDGEALGSTKKLTAIGGAGHDTIWGSEGSDSLSGGAGDDEISTWIGDDTVDGGAGNDYIYTGTSGIMSLSGGDGDDLIEMWGSLNGEDSVDGGAGTNTLAIEAGAINLDFLNVRNIQTLSLLSGGTTTLGSNAIAAGINRIESDGNNSDTVNAAALTNGVTFVTGTGNDNLTGSAGNDTFVFSGNNQLQWNDTIAAGAGADVIRLDNASAAGVGAEVQVELEAVAGVESIVVNDLSLASNTTGDVYLRLNQAFTSVNNVTVIDGSALDLGEMLYVDAAANFADDVATTTVNEAEAVYVLGGAGADEVYGGEANDTVLGNSGSDYVEASGGDDSVSGGDGRDELYGDNGDDVLNGGAGNDVLYGGAGQDTLTGGAGADIFAIEDQTESTGSTLDVVTDFTSGSDRIFISEQTIEYGQNVVWKGNAANFEAAQALLVVGEAGAVYNQVTHTLWVDANIDGTLNANDIQIVLSNVTGLVEADVYSDWNSPTVDGISTWIGAVAAYNDTTSLETDDVVTIADTYDNINANLAALFADSKIDVIDATGAPGTTITLTQAQASVTANLAKLVSGDDVTVTDVLIDTQAEAVAAYDIAAVDHVDITAAGNLVLTQAAAVAANAAKLSTNGTITVSDVAVNTAAEVAALGAASYVDVIDITAAGTVGLSMVQYALNGGGAKLSANGTVTINDSSMSAANIGTYNGFANVDAINFTGGTVTLTQQQALDATKLGTGGTVHVVDTAIDTQDEYNALQALARVDDISINGGTLTLDVPSALAATKLQTSGTVTVSGSAADVLANWSALTGVSGVAPSIDGFDLTDNAISLTEAQYDAFSAGSKNFASDDVVTITGQVGASDLDASQAVIKLTYTSGAEASVVTFDQNGSDTTLLDSGDRFNVSNADVITGFGSGDTIDLTAFQLSGAAQVTDFTTDFTVLRDDSYYVANGSYNSGTGEFTNGAGSDSLVMFDSNTGAGNTAINMVAVVVVGSSVTSADLVLV